uniref:Uncharacterized protein n=1 Tax=Mycolicibacterium gilvum (strain PYR-GCK) TaxID=350054 RepID=A4TFX8_MYCGI
MTADVTRPTITPYRSTAITIDEKSGLNRLVELEPAQAELLGRILDRPVASYSDLASAGVEWPGAANDPRRRANQAPVAKETQADDDVDGQLGFTFH